jgi:hypothetical protein
MKKLNPLKDVFLAGVDGQNGNTFYRMITTLPVGRMTFTAGQLREALILAAKRQDKEITKEEFGGNDNRND